MSFSQFLKRMQFGRLYPILQSLKGKKCWKAEFTYGGEMCLHFGARVPYANPKMAGKSKGAWILGTCGTPWHIVTPCGSLSSENGSEQEPAPQIKGLEGSTVANVGVSVPDGALTIVFTNRCRFLVTPGPRDRRYDLPYWELFLPDHGYLALGGENKWSYSRSNVPPRRQPRSPRRKAPLRGAVRRA